MAALTFDDIEDKPKSGTLTFDDIPAQKLNIIALIFILCTAPPLHAQWKQCNGLYGGNISGLFTVGNTLYAWNRCTSLMLLKTMFLIAQ